MGSRSRTQRRDTGGSTVHAIRGSFGQKRITRLGRRPLMEVREGRSGCLSTNDGAPAGEPHRFDRSHYPEGGTMLYR